VECLQQSATETLANDHFGDKIRVDDRVVFKIYLKEIGCDDVM
jgi:hypothetical protein